MSEAPAQPAFECDECGYPLTGLARAGQSVRCPECGRRHAYPPPLTRRPWPSLPRMALAMCGPCAAFVAVFVGLTAIPGVYLYLIVMWGVLTFAWLSSVVGPPVLYATDAARHCLLRPRRRPAALALAGAGMGANLMISAVGVWIASLF